MKKITFVSIDPADSSRRIINQVNTAVASGFSVKIITVKRDGKSAFNNIDNIAVHYITLRYNGGIRKFLEFNFKLSFILFAEKFDILFCRGLWVFPGVIPVKLFKNFKIIYDAHEYFAGHTHFDKKPLKRTIWLNVEKIAMKMIDLLITVSEPIGKLYQRDYPKLDNVYIIRNLPTRVAPNKTAYSPLSQKNIKNVVFSGYLLPGRSLTTIIKSFSFIKEDSINLHIIGEGILYDELNQLCEDLNIQNKVTFLPMVANDEIVSLLQKFDLGLSLIETDCVNRSLALPNKLFEYIAAGIPVLASNISTQKTYIDKYKLGRYINPSNPEVIAGAIMEMLADEKKYRFWQENCLIAARELNWENESQKLKKIYALFI